MRAAIALRPLALSPPPSLPNDACVEPGAQLARRVAQKQIAGGDQLVLRIDQRHLCAQPRRHPGFLQQQAQFARVRLARWLEVLAALAIAYLERNVECSN